MYVAFVKILQFGSTFVKLTQFEHVLISEPADWFWKPRKWKYPDPTGKSGSARTTAPQNMPLQGSKACTFVTLSLWKFGNSCPSSVWHRKASLFNFKGFDKVKKRYNILVKMKTTQHPPENKHSLHVVIASWWHLQHILESICPTNSILLISTPFYTEISGYCFVATKLIRKYYMSFGGTCR